MASDPEANVVDTSNNTSIYDDIKSYKDKLQNKAYLINDVAKDKSIDITDITSIKDISSNMSTISSGYKTSSGLTSSISSIDYPSGNQYYNKNAQLEFEKATNIPDKYYFFSIYYANNIWVAGSSYYGLWYSTNNGKSWYQSNITTGRFDSVYYANNIWVAGNSYLISQKNGNKGLLYSTDGITWYQSNIISNGFSHIYYANNIWVACSEKNYSSGNGIWYSIDGTTWTQSSSYTSIVFNNLYYAKGIWVAGGSNGIYYSTDNAITWTKSSSDILGSFGYIYYANNIWVAGNVAYGDDSGLYYSEDGMNWYQSNITSGTYYKIHYVNNIWVAGNSSDANNKGLLYSEDGMNWYQSNITSYLCNYLCYGNNIWVASSYEEQNLYYSTDGKTWIGLINDNSDKFNGGIYYDNNIYIACGNGIYYCSKFLLSNPSESVGIGSAYEYSPAKLSVFSTTDLKANTNVSWAAQPQDYGTCRDLILYGSESDVVKAANEADGGTRKLCYKRPNDDALIDLSDIVFDAYFDSCCSVDEYTADDYSDAYEYFHSDDGYIKVIPNDYHYLIQINVDGRIYIPLISQDLINWHMYYDEIIDYGAINTLVDNKGRVLLFNDKKLNNTIYLGDKSSGGIFLSNPPDYTNILIPVPILHQLTSISSEYTEYSMNSTFSIEVGYTDTTTYICVYNSVKDIVIELGDEYDSKYPIEVPRMIEGSLILNDNITTLNELDFTPDRAIFTLRNGNSDSNLDYGTIIASKKDEFKSIRKSFDKFGSVWTKSSSQSGTYFNCICYGNDIWVAGTDTYLFYSKNDGVTWTRCTGTGGNYKDIAYGKMSLSQTYYWIAVTSDSSGLFYSTDGIKWSVVSTLADSSFNCVYYSSKSIMFIAGTDDKTGIYYSVNGTIWKQSSNVTSVSIKCIYGNDNIKVFGSNSSTGLWYSTDGMEWYSTKSDGNFNCVYYANNIWVAGGYDNIGLWYSTDGKSWTQSSQTTLVFSSIYYGNGTWVAVGSGIYYSTDNGKTWTKTVSNSIGFESVVYANNMWVACGSKGIYYSTDGITWTQSISAECTEVYYANNVFITAAKGIYYSKLEINESTSISNSNIIPLNESSVITASITNDDITAIQNWDGSSLDSDILAVYDNIKNNAIIDGGTVQVSIEDDYIGAIADYKIMGRKFKEASNGRAEIIKTFIGNIERERER
jgi:hypothetical protein